jgi:hypothetical protein
MDSQNGEKLKARITKLGALSLILFLLAISCNGGGQTFTPPVDIKAYEEVTVYYDQVAATYYPHRLPYLDNKYLYYDNSVECLTAEGEAIPVLIDGKPDIRLDWQGADDASQEQSPLRLFFVPDDPRKASFLYVRNSEGQYNCYTGTESPDSVRPDDFASYPMADLAIAPPGDYYIWVGVSEDEGDTLYGTLFATANLAVNAYEVQINPWGDAETELALETDFAPDPVSLDVSGKANIDLTHLNVGKMWKNVQSCEGFAIGVDPTARITWPGDIDLRTYFVKGDDSAEGILIVHATNGENPNPTSDWYCNSYKPLLTAFESGWFDGVTFNVWLAGFAPEDTISGRLFFSRLDFNTENPSGVNILGPPILGEGTFTGDVINKSFDDLVSLVDAINLDEDRCGGYFTTREPAYILNWSERGYIAIHALFEPETRDKLKPALMVVDPMGIAECVSPSISNPVITYTATADRASESDGEYLVWIGSRIAGTNLQGSLCITDVGDSPSNPCR